MMMGEADGDSSDEANSGSASSSTEIAALDATVDSAPSIVSPLKKANWFCGVVRKGDTGGTVCGERPVMATVPVRSAKTCRVEGCNVGRVCGVSERIAEVCEIRWTRDCERERDRECEEAVESERCTSTG